MAIPIRKTVVKYGLVLGIVLTTYAYFIFQANLIENTIISNLDTLFMIALTILAFKEYKYLNNGFLPFNTAFRLGIMIFLIGTLMISVFIYIYIEYINHDVISMLLDNIHRKLDAENFTEGSLDSTLKFLEKYIVTSKGIASINFLLYSFIGLIITLVTAFFMKRNVSF